MDAKQPVVAPPSGGHRAGIMDKSPSAQQLSVGGGESNRRSRNRDQRNRRQANQDRGSCCARQGTGSTPASVPQIPCAGLSVTGRGSLGGYQSNHQQQFQPA